MNRLVVRVARVTVLPLVLASAAFHLWWGFPRAIVNASALSNLASRGLPPDPRPFLFVVFGLALLAGPYLVTREVITLRQAYLLGLAAMVVSLLGWLAWHATGHGAFLVGGSTGTATEASHDVGLVHLVVDHYVTEPVEGVLKSVELVAAALFALLLRFDPEAE